METSGASTAAEKAGTEALPEELDGSCRRSLVPRRVRRGLALLRVEGTMYSLPPNTHWKTTAPGSSGSPKGSSLPDREAPPLPCGTPRISRGALYTNVWDDRHQRIRLGEALRRPNLPEGRGALHLDDDRPGRPGLRPHLRIRDDRICRREAGRRWVTCDTSRVAINVTRQRLLSAVFAHYRTRNGIVSGGFVHNGPSSTSRSRVSHTIWSRRRVHLVDEPDVDPSAVRVTGPFEVLTLGRYSVEDWKGYVTDGERRQPASSRTTST